MPNIRGHNTILLISGKNRFSNIQFHVVTSECHLYSNISNSILTFQVPEMKIAEFVNSIDLDEVPQNEPPQLDLHCWHSSL